MPKSNANRYRVRSNKNIQCLNAYYPNIVPNTVRVKPTFVSGYLKRRLLSSRSSFQKKKKIAETDGNPTEFTCFFSAVRKHRRDDERKHP